MTVLARRVLEASVVVDKKIVSKIDYGLLLYVGISIDDDKKQCEYYAKKVANLRIFESIDENGKEQSITDIKGGILSVSQFTLSADTKKGSRPSYSYAMPSSQALPLFDYFNECLEKQSGLKVLTGVFGADMKINAIDDGPFTIIMQYNIK